MLTSVRKSLVDVAKGDLPGHPFRGNQCVDEDWQPQPGNPCDSEDGQPNPPGTNGQADARSNEQAGVLGSIKPSDLPPSSDSSGIGEPGGVPIITPRTEDDEGVAASDVSMGEMIADMQSEDLRAGGTLSPYKLEPIEDMMKREPAEGFAVALPRSDVDVTGLVSEGENVFDDDEFLAARNQLEEWWEDLADVRRSGKVWRGHWTWEGKTGAELTVVFEREEDAIRFGNLWDQKAYWDFRKARSTMEELGYPDGEVFLDPRNEGGGGWYPGAPIPGFRE